MSKESLQEYKRRVIDIKSESFCGAKYYDATFWLGSGRTASCHLTPPHPIILDDIEKNPKALHNTDQKKLERDMMRKGERPSGCNYCWRIEDADTNNISSRIFENFRCSEEDLETAFRADSNLDFNLRSLEISFDRTCQFACSYCGPELSTTWVKDIKKYGPYVDVNDERNTYANTSDFAQLFQAHQENPYVDAFFKWWESDLYQTVKEIKITGGEPLVSGHTWKLLEWVRKTTKKDQIKLGINTNLGVEKDVLIKLLDYSDSIDLEIYTSNESTNSQAEYIRDGLNWTQWLDNVEYILSTNKLKENRLKINSTVGATGAIGLTKLLELVQSLKQKYGLENIMFTLSLQEWPKFQSVLVLPKEIKQNIADNLDQFYIKNKEMLNEVESNHVNRLITFLRKNLDHADADNLKLSFKNFYTQYDQRRNKDFTGTFPELANWYNNIK